MGKTVDELVSQVTALKNIFEVQNAHVKSELAKYVHGIEGFDEIDPNWTTCDLLTVMLGLLGSGVDVQGGTLKFVEQAVLSDRCRIESVLMPVIRAIEKATLTDRMVSRSEMPRVRDVLTALDRADVKAPVELISAIGDLATLQDRFIASETNKTGNTLAAMDNVTVLAPMIDEHKFTESVIARDRARVDNTRDVVVSTAALTDRVTILIEAL